MEFRTGRVAGYALMVLGHRFCGPIGSIGQDEGADLSRRVICSM